MASSEQESIRDPNTLKILSGVLELAEEPGAVVSDSGEIKACNDAWPGSSDSSKNSGRTLRENLDRFRGVGVLLDGMQTKLQSDTIPQTGVSSITTKHTPYQTYDAHWRRFGTSENRDGLTLVVLHPPRSLLAQGDRIRVDRLFVRQTLIEEAERLRLGRALHDTVIQDLAWIRTKIKTKANAPPDSEVLVEAIDGVIAKVRTLSFELSPPILDDFGLIAAIHWLGEHIGPRYGTSISVIDDGIAPDLPKSVSTIVFRCARELVVNAAKYAPQSEIIVSCMTTETDFFVRVRDFGQGFIISKVHSPVDEQSGFGLLSVEQQLLGIGAVLELVSEPGSGTRATIRVPLPSRESGFS